MNQNYFIGVDLGGTKIYTAISNEKGEIVNSVLVKTEAEKGTDQIVEKIKNSIKKVINNISIKNIKAIGIGSPGPIDAKSGCIVSPPNLPFKDFNIVEEIKEEFNIPVYLDNDANAAVLGEYIFGAGAELEGDNMIYITASTGVGAGAVLNGKIYRGSTSNALELGHTTVDYYGRRCGCGNRGCVESMASGTAIKRLADEAIKTNVNTSLKKYEDVTAKEVFTEYSNGDRVSKEILREALGYLGVAVANAANVFDPDIIVIGGGVSEGGDIVLEIINEVMEERVLGPIKEHCMIKKSKLGGEVGVLGAIALAITESMKG